MRSCDVDDVHVWVCDELGVRAIGFCAAGGFDFFEKVGGPRGGGGRGCCCDDVLNIVDFAGSRVSEEVFRKCWRKGGQLVSTIVMEE